MIGVVAILLESTCATKSIIFFCFKIPFDITLHVCYLDDIQSFINALSAISSLYCQ